MVTNRSHKRVEIIEFAKVPNKFEAAPSDLAVNAVSICLLHIVSDPKVMTTPSLLIDMRSLSPPDRINCNHLYQ